MQISQYFHSLYGVGIHPATLLRCVTPERHWLHSHATLLADGRRALSWSADRTLQYWDLVSRSRVGIYVAYASINTVSVVCKRAEFLQAKHWVTSTAST